MKVELDQNVIRCHIHYHDVSIIWAKITKVGRKYAYLGQEKFYISTGYQVEGFASCGISTIHDTPASAATYLRDWRLNEILTPYFDGRHIHDLQRLTNTTKISMVKELGLTLPLVDILEIPQPPRTVNSWHVHVQRHEQQASLGG